MPRSEGFATREPGHLSGSRSPVRVRSILRYAAAGLYLFNSLDWLRRGETSLTRWLWILSIVLFVLSLASFPFRRERTAERPNDLPRLAAGILLGLIVLAAFLLRFVDLATVPLDVHGDFASMGLGARDILEGRVSALFATAWADLPWAAYLQPALAMRVFGDDLFGMNMGAVIAGTATVIGIYFLTETLFNNRSLALIAAAISAIGYTDIHFGRVAAYIDPVPWVVFGLYFLCEGLKSAKGLMFGLSGISLAVGFEMYYSGRLALVVIVLFLAYLGIFHRSLLLRRWKGLLLLLAAGLLATGPYLLFHLSHFDSFMGRTRQVYALSPGNVTHLLHKYNTTSRARMMLEQTWRSLLTFNYTGDSSTQFGFNRPLMNPALAPLLVLGLAIVTRRFRSAGYALLLIWFVTAVVLGSVLTIDAPFWPRLVILLPAAAILTAIALELVLRTAIELIRRRPSPAPILIPAAAVLAVVGYENWRLYSHGSLRTFVAPIAWVGRLIGESPPGTGYCMIRGPLTLADRVPQFLAKGHDLMDVPPEELGEYKQRCIAEGRVWVILRPDHDELLASLNREWPDARQERHDFPSGEPGPIFWYPPPAPGANVSPGGP